MSIDTASAPPLEAAPPPPDPYSRTTLILGVLGRVWIWFILGCLAIALVPLLFGWQAFVIKSGSMEPHISIGDVVLTSPETNPQVLSGRVMAFDAPETPGEILVHREVGQDAAGLLITKGDANRTPDSAHVAVSHVHGIGRLLVRYIGLPIVWLETGQWLWLLLFLASVALAVLAVVRDSDDAEPDPDADNPDSGGDGGNPDAPEAGPDTAPVVGTDSSPAPQGSPAPSTSRIAAAPATFWRLARRRLRNRPVWVPRVLVILIGTMLMVIPGAYSAYSATTTNPGNSWNIPFYNYTTQTNALGPYLYWKLDETGTTNAVAADSSGNARTGTYSPSAAAANFTRGVTGALVDQTPNTGVTQNSTNACINTTSTTAINAPTTFTEIIWFKAPSGYTAGGKLIGFETPRTGVAVAGSGGTYDRHIYMDGAGKVWFGVYNGGDDLIKSTASYNDGAWHMAAATLSATGMNLFIDGVSVGTNANNVGEASTGWFRVGCGNLAGWADGWTGANTPPASTTATNYPFLGSIDEATVYLTALTPAQIAFLYWIR